MSRDAVGWHDVSGLFADVQVRAWSAVTDAVHREGGVIFVQLWHIARRHIPLLRRHTAGRLRRPSTPTVSSPTPSGNKPTVTPRAMTRDDIRATINDYAAAAANAMRAGFDGVRLQAGFNYLIASSSTRAPMCDPDAYGGSIETGHAVVRCARRRRRAHRSRQGGRQGRSGVGGTR